jgi:hypothetical protein
MFKATAKLYDAAQKVSARVVRISVVAISEFLRHHLLLRLEVLHLLAELEPSLRHVQQKKLVLRICGGPRVRQAVLCIATQFFRIAHAG